MKLKETPVYETVLRILRERPETRESDKKLIWRVWQEMGLVTWDYHSQTYYITEEGFFESTNVGSIKRARRESQSKYPELEPQSQAVRRSRGLKEATKGTFIFREGSRTGSIF